MRRCTICQFDNASQARVCARCGQALVVASSPTEATGPVLPDWMQSIQRGGEQAAAPITLGASSGAVALAATLPVQVRRSRVPVLSVSERVAAGPTVTMSPAPVAVASPASNPGVSRGQSNRLRYALLLAILVLALAYLVVRMYS